MTLTKIIYETLRCDLPVLRRLTSRNYLNSVKINFLCQLSRTSYSTSTDSENIAFKNDKNILKNFYRSYLIKNPDFSQSLFHEKLLLPNKDTNSKTIKLFREINDNVEYISNADNDISLNINVDDRADLELKLLESLNEEISTLSYLELLEVVYFYAKYTTPLKKNKFRALIDTECMNRFRNLTMDEILRLLDVLNGRKDFVSFSFIRKNFKKLGSRSPKFNDMQLVLMLYFCRCSKMLDTCTLKFWMRLEKMIPSLNIEDIGLICHGIEHKIPHKPLLYAIIRKTTDHIEDVNSVVLRQVCKVISGSKKNLHLEDWKALENKLIPLVSKFSPEALFCVLEAGHIVGYMNLHLRNSIYKQIKENFNELHLSTSLQFLLIFAKDNYKDDEVIQMAINKIENLEIPKYISLILNFLRALIYFKVYPDRLINKTLSFAYENSLKNVADLCGLYYIEECLQMDYPEFYAKNEFLYSKRKINFSERYCIRRIGRLPKQPYLQAVFMYHLKSLYGGNKVMWMRPLMQYNSVPVMKFDRNLIAQDILQHKKLEFLGKKVNDDEHYWVYFLLMTVCDFTPIYHENSQNHSSKAPNLIAQTHFRHFASSGCNVVQVPFSLIKDSGKNFKLKPDLEKIIDTQLQEIVKERGQEISQEDVIPM